MLYPIILPNRLELLLGIGERQYRTTVNISADKIHTAAENFASILRPSVELSDPNSLANQLFSWLIAPVKFWLDLHEIDTLIFIPDGPLRLFPLAVLMDDNHFLIERYVVVTAPGLTLFDAQPIPHNKIDALVVGVSKPGPVVNELPNELLNNLGDLRALNLFNDNDLTKTIGNNLDLPGVEREVKLVSNLLGVTPLLNENFVLSNFTTAMEHSWHIVHIASHGFFSGSADTSFFMMYDQLLKVSQLEKLIHGDGKTKESPNLLILSACQTAEGNNRAPLGIAGMAIKSGARSVIGFLWPVSDDATQLLITQFYQQLNMTGSTKARAFQQAQIALLNNENFKHPFFWAPFILVGNWL